MVRGRPAVVVFSSVFPGLVLRTALAGTPVTTYYLDTALRTNPEQDNRNSPSPPRSNYRVEQKSTYQYMMVDHNLLPAPGYTENIDGFTNFNGLKKSVEFMGGHISEYACFVNRS